MPYETLDGIYKQTRQTEQEQKEAIQRIVNARKEAEQDKKEASEKRLAELRAKREAEQEAKIKKDQEAIERRSQQQNAKLEEAIRREFAVRGVPVIFTVLPTVYQVDPRIFETYLSSFRICNVRS